MPLSCGAQFIDKNSKKMNIDLREAVSENFGFGDFIFRNPNTMEEVVRVHNLKELQNAISLYRPNHSFITSVVIIYRVGYIRVPYSPLQSS